MLVSWSILMKLWHYMKKEKKKKKKIQITLKEKKNFQKKRAKEINQSTLHIKQKEKWKKKKTLENKSKHGLSSQSVTKLTRYRLKANTFTGSLNYSSTRRIAQGEREGVAGQKRERFGVPVGPTPSQSQALYIPITTGVDSLALLHSFIFTHSPSLSLYIYLAAPKTQTRNPKPDPIRLTYHHPRDFSWWVVVLLWLWLSRAFHTINTRPSFSVFVQNLISTCLCSSELLRAHRYSQPWAATRPSASRRSKTSPSIWYIFVSVHSLFYFSVLRCCMCLAAQKMMAWNKRKCYEKLRSNWNCTNFLCFCVINIVSSFPFFWVISSHFDDFNFLWSTNILIRFPVLPVSVLSFWPTKH